jgi:TatA/E family protein of Tat protein translocase
MGEFSIFHWLIVLAVVLIFFGGRRIPEVMKGLGEGIRSFKDGMSGGAATATATAAAPAPAASVAAPTGLSAKAGKGQVSLSWNGVAGANNYVVMRSGSSGGPYARISTTSSTNYSDEGLTGGTTFYYAVASSNGALESGNSVEVSATAA